MAWAQSHVKYRSFTLAGSLRGLVRQLSIDQFENESRRVSIDSLGKLAQQAQRSPLFEPRSNSEPSVHKLVRTSCKPVV